jgi:hypothetical protein
MSRFLSATGRDRWCRHRAVLTAAAAVALVVMIASGVWIAFDRPAIRGDRFVQPGSSKPAPSGQYTAAAENGPVQNGVATWVVLVRDTSGAEVFRDDYAYSLRHGVGITWLSSADQLWVLSADVGTAHIDRAPDGSWHKTLITPETVATIPEEIRNLRDRNHTAPPTPCPSPRWVKCYYTV